MPNEEQTYRAGILDRLEEIQENVSATLVQAKITNGRVNKLEQDAAVFRARIYTAVSLLSFILGSMIIPILSSYIQAGKL